MYVTTGLFSLIVFYWSSIHHVIIFLKVSFSFYIFRRGGHSSIFLYTITIRKNCHASLTPFLICQFLYTSLFILFFHVPLNYILFEILSLAVIIALIFHFYPLPNPFLFYVANHNCLYALEISILTDFGMNFISAKIGSDCVTAMYVLDFA